MTDRLHELKGGVSYAEEEEECDQADCENGSGEAMDSAMQREVEKFSNEMEALQSDIEKVEKDTKDLEKYFAASLDGGGDSTKSKIKSLLAENEEKSQTIRKKLRQLGDENKAFKKAYPQNISELKLRVTQHQNIAKRFMVAMQDFEAAQDVHRKAVKGQLEEQLQKMNPDVSKAEIARAVRDGETTELAGGDSTFAQLPPEERERLKRGLADLNARNADIRKLEESIVQLHQLFVDMQIMVEAQGELLNNAEYDIGEVKTTTHAALDDLVQARAHQKSARKKKIWIIIICVGIVLTIVISLLIKFAPNWVNATRKSIVDTITGNDGTNSTTPTSPVTNGTATNTTRLEAEGAREAVSLVQLVVDHKLE